jgi:hypothetical protein
MRIEIAVICACAATIVSRAAAADHFPLTEGINYEYEYSISQGAGTYATYFSGVIDVEGMTAHVYHYSGGVDDRLLHFWSETTEGDKLFRGSRLDGYSIIHVPSDSHDR